MYMGTSAVSIHTGHSRSTSFSLIDLDKKSNILVGKNIKIKLFLNSLNLLFVALTP